MIENINTSEGIQNIYKKYLFVCERASVNDEVFDTFKSNPNYNAVLEHCSYELGKKHLEAIRKNNPDLLSTKAWENDKIGKPVVYSYEGIGVYSPTTLQYLNVVSNLLMKFGDFTGWNIVEIGGGYGGQCKIIQDCLKINHYAIVDLPEPILLMEKYLSKLEYINYVTFHKSDSESFPFGKLKNDLFISNYALSEMPCYVQLKYVKEIALKCTHGYITCNDRVEGMELIKKKFKSFAIEPDIEGERETNFIITW